MCVCSFVGTGLWPAGSVVLFLVLCVLLLAGLCTEVLDVQAHLRNNSKWRERGVFFPVCCKKINKTQEGIIIDT